MTTTPKPPVAAMKPHEVKSPHGARNDEYYWLRDDTRQDKEVLAYLEAENAYKEAMLAHVRAARGQGSTARSSAASSRTTPACRTASAATGTTGATRRARNTRYTRARRARCEAPEQVMLDVTRWPRATTSTRSASSRSAPTTGCSPTPRTRSAAASTRCASRTSRPARRCRTRSRTSRASVAWAADNRTRALHREGPADAARPQGAPARARHRPAARPGRLRGAGPELLRRRRHDQGRALPLHLLAAARCRASSAYADAADPELAFRMLVPRERDHEYQADHFDGRWIMRTNWQAPNFRIVEAAGRLGADRGTWRDLVPHRDDGFVHGFERVPRLPGRRASAPAACARSASGPGTAARSPTSPRTSRPIVPTSRENEEIDTRPGALHLHVADHADAPPTTTTCAPASARCSSSSRCSAASTPANYATEYLWAPARDGEQGAGVARLPQGHSARDGTAPLLQYGYGSYGSSHGPDVHACRVLSLLDRGFVYAIAHVRGGQEMGRRWYEDGRLLKKKNTFNDFIDVTRFLVQAGLRRPEARVRAGRQRRRPADGRGRQPGAAGLPRPSSRTCRSWTWSRRCSTRPSR